MSTLLNILATIFSEYVGNFCLLALAWTLLTPVILVASVFDAGNYSSNVRARYGAVRAWCLD